MVAIIKLNDEYLEFLQANEIEFELQERYEETDLIKSVEAFIKMNYQNHKDLIKALNNLKHPK